MKKMFSKILILFFLLSGVACSEAEEASLQPETINLSEGSDELHHLLLKEYKKKESNSTKAKYPSIYEKNTDGVTNPYIEFIFEKDIQGGDLKEHLKKYLQWNADQASDYYSLWTVLYLEEIGISLSEQEGTRIEASTRGLKINGTQEAIDKIRAILEPTNKGSNPEVINRASPR